MKRILFFVLIFFILSPTLFCYASEDEVNDCLPHEFSYPLCVESFRLDLHPRADGTYRFSAGVVCWDAAKKALVFGGLYPYHVVCRGGFVRIEGNTEGGYSLDSTNTYFLLNLPSFGLDYCYGYGEYCGSLLNRF